MTSQWLISLSPKMTNPTNGTSLEVRLEICHRLWPIALCSRFKICSVIVNLIGGSRQRDSNGKRSKNPEDFMIPETQEAHNDVEHLRAELRAELSPPRLSCDSG
ncbi:hypothetical protein QN277_004034 [Acacia crassicarpa]|uniref:Uncharacterized protein n=1 Tax=Acacia crassicarpa TaxID=499986 RepID=A0AAE1MG83_9FABA|nr:hypothetical protein QN277_004034 [Acacia crassicarpa]